MVLTSSPFYGIMEVDHILLLTVVNFFPRRDGAPCIRPLSMDLGFFPLMGLGTLAYASESLPGDSFFKKNIFRIIISYFWYACHVLFRLSTISLYGCLYFLEWDGAGRIRFQSLKMRIKKDPPAPPGGSLEKGISCVLFGFSLLGKR